MKCEHFKLRYYIIYPIILFVIAFIIRVCCCEILGLGGASDTPFFLHVAKSIAHGKYHEIVEYPFHSILSLLLSIDFLLFGGKLHFAKYLMIGLSSLTVIFVHMVTIRLSPPRFSWLPGVMAVFYPNFIFWSRFILTDTLFLFLLSLYMFLILDLVNHLSLKNIISITAISIILFFTRPTSIAILAISIPFATFYVLRKHYSLQRPHVLVCFYAIGLLILFSCLSFTSSIREGLLKIPTIYQSLWLSTRVSTSDIRHIEANINVPSDTMLKNEEEQRLFKIRYATDFIKKHPVRYLQMAGERFVSFWLPWIFAKWSLRHKILDAICSIVLILGSVFAILNREHSTGSFAKQRLMILFLSALSLSLLSAFSQIDSEGRYRLPAELLLLPLIPFGITNILSSIINSVNGRRENHTSNEI